jgi:hypothetical protein
MVYMKNIISVSRRTDIPAFYAKWFTRRLEAGHVYVLNPYNKRFNKVSLRPENMHCFVFWSKNYAPLIPYLNNIEKISKNLFFHFTITGMPKTIEVNSPTHVEAIRDLIYLSKRYSPKHVIWRFDPICITDKLSFAYYEDIFTQCAEQMKGHCNSCYISFVNKYKKVITNFARYTDHSLIEFSHETLRQHSLKLSSLAAKYAIRLYACCNDYLLSDKVYKGACIDANYLAALFDKPDITSSAGPTRKECACDKSIDIGAYDTCPHGCAYCYANADIVTSREAYLKQQEYWNALGRNIQEGEDLLSRSDQGDLF